MKKKYLLAALLCAAMGTANAKGDVTVTTQANALGPNYVDVIVSMTNEENEVRGLECTFTLPDGITFVTGSSSYNEDRFDGFISTLDIRDCNHISADKSSKVTFMSLSGDYVYGTEGEIFRFSVKVPDDTRDLAFPIYSEISYDNKKVDNETVMVDVSDITPYSASVMQTEVIELGDDEAVIGLAIKNDELPVGGLELVVELPEGMSFVTATDKKGVEKVVWTYSKRVSSAKSPSEKLVTVTDEETGVQKQSVKLAVIDAMTSDNGLIGVGEGEVLSFKVKGSLDLALDSKVVIKDIKLSNVKGKQFNLAETLEVDVKNIALVENTLDVIKQQVAEVQAAVETFDSLVQTMEYAKQYEGEEITAPVDAAREWIDATLAAANEKYEAKNLSKEDYVMGEMMEQVAAVNEALNNAAKYDAYRYVQAAVYYWAGDEDEIEGVVESVLADIAALPEAKQAELTALVEAMETEMAELIAANEAYVAYNEDAHAEIIAKSESVVAQIAGILEAVEKAKAVPGDVDGDGAVNGYDVALVIADVLQKELPDGYIREAADMDGDGKVDGYDVALLISKVLEK